MIRVLVNEMITDKDFYGLYHESMNAEKKISITVLSVNPDGRFFEVKSFKKRVLSGYFEIV